MEDLHTPSQLGIVSRRKAREAALQALYQFDTCGECSERELDIFFEHFFPGSAAPSLPESFDNYRYARRLVEGVLVQIVFVDKHIGAASLNWSIERMARIDRNILRIAVYEMLCVDAVPATVAINEAVEIAKRFSSEEAPMFINGVLDQVRKSVVVGVRRLA